MGHRRSGREGGRGKGGSGERGRREEGGGRGGEGKGGIEDGHMCASSDMQDMLCPHTYMNNHVHSAPPEWQEHSRLKNLQQTVLKKFGKKFVKQPQWLRKYMSPKSSRGLKIFLHVSVYLRVHSWLLRGEAEPPWSPSPRSGPHTWEEDDPQMYMYTHYSPFPSVAERIGHTTCT